MGMGFFGELGYLRPEADFVVKAEIPASGHRMSKTGRLSREVTRSSVTSALCRGNLGIGLAHDSWRPSRDDPIV